MTEDEMYDMITMCAQAFKGGKKLQVRSLFGDLLWGDSGLGLVDVVDVIMDFGREYRVKPEPKTVRVRMYWYKRREIGSIGGPCHAIDDNIEWIVHSSEFHSWAGDEQILTVPEV